MIPKVETRLAHRTWIERLLLWRHAYETKIWESGHEVVGRGPTPGRGRQAKMERRNYRRRTRQRHIAVSEFNSAMHSPGDSAALSAEDHCSRSSRGDKLTSLESRRGEEDRGNKASASAGALFSCVLWATFDHIFLLADLLPQSRHACALSYASNLARELTGEGTQKAGCLSKQSPAQLAGLFSLRWLCSKGKPRTGGRGFRELPVGGTGSGRRGKIAQPLPRGLRCHFPDVRVRLFHPIFFAVTS
jgi:hypothetical protein